MKFKFILPSLTVLPAIVLLSGGLPGRGAEGVIDSRTNLLADLGTNAVTEDFEGLVFPTNTAVRVSALVDATSVIDGQGPGLVKPGVRFMQYPAVESDPDYGLQWDRQFQYGTTSAALLCDYKLIVDFTVPVSHVGLDMFWFDVGSPLDPSTVEVYAANDLTLLYRTNIFEPFAPDSCFFGYADSVHSIGRVVLYRVDFEGELSYGPMIDNLTFGAVPGSMTAGLTNYLALNFSLTIGQQALSATNKSGDGKTYLWTVGKMRLDNKSLLKLLATASGTSWPPGARLVYDLQTRQVVVTDKTGTNALYDCSDSASHPDVYVGITWDADAGPLSGKLVQSDPPTSVLTADWEAGLDIHLASTNGWPLPLDFHASGLTVERYLAKAAGAGSLAYIQEQFTPFSLGQLNGQRAVLGGRITAFGKTADTLTLRPY